MATIPIWQVAQILALLTSMGEQSGSPVVPPRDAGASAPEKEAKQDVSELKQEMKDQASKQKLQIQEVKQEMMEVKQEMKEVKEEVKQEMKDQVRTLAQSSFPGVWVGTANRSEKDANEHLSPLGNAKES